MNRRVISIAAAVLLVISLGIWYWLVHRIIYVPGSLPQQAMVQSTTWSPAVRQAIQTRAGEFDKLNVLAMDIFFADGQPKVLTLPVDFAALALTHNRIGLVVKIEPIPANVASPFAPNSAVTAFIGHTISDLFAAAKDKALQPSELMLDFDSPNDQLNDYSNSWVPAARSACPSGVTCSIISQPHWFDSPSYSSLAKSNPPMILKIPTGDSAAQIQQTTEQAASFGFPFLISLPIYAKSDSPSVRPDAAALTTLLTSWTASHPQLLVAIIWDRLPTDDDPLNWHWPTLQAVMHGNAPQPDLKIELRNPSANITEIDLVNKGSADASFDADVNVSWSDADIQESQALTDFEKKSTGRYSLTFVRQPPLSSQRLAPGDQRAIGWIHLTDDAPIHTEFAH